MDKEIAHKVRPLVEDKLSWDGLLAAIDSNINDCRKANDTADANAVLRNQGAIAALSKLKHLRDEVKAHLKD